jgi:hypothetical protein
MIVALVRCCELFSTQPAEDSFAGLAHHLVAAIGFFNRNLNGAQNKQNLSFFNHKSTKYDFVVKLFRINTCMMKKYTT